MKQQTEVGKLKVGKYVIVDDEVCVIKSITKSKPGKHGSAKARMDVIGLFDNQKRSVVQPVNAKIYVPIVDRRSAQVISIAGDIVQLMDMETYETIELRVTPEELEKLEEGKDVSYLTGLGKMKIDLR
ncbi:MAG: translation initiation factor IF-5A [Methermicoccaceae archaeon]